MSGLLRGASGPFGLAAIVLAGVLVSPSGARADTAELSVARPVVGPDPTQPVPVAIHVVNRATTGFYLDSVSVQRASERPSGAPARPRSVPMRASSVGAGETRDFAIPLAAARDSERVTLVFFTRGGGLADGRLERTVTLPGIDLQHYFPPVPAKFAGREVEITHVNAPGAEERGPGVLFLRGQDTPIEPDLRAAIALSQGGVTVMLVTPPGTGGSRGPADFNGPASLAVAREALDSLGTSPFVDPTNVLVLGSGTGACLALLVAEARPDIRGVIALGASVDPWATYRAAGEKQRREMVAQAGRDSAGWRTRSPLAGVDRLRVPALLFHGDHDDVAPVIAEEGFVALLRARGANVEAYIYPGQRNVVLEGQPMALTRRFIRSNTGPR
jgi:pimeloyl-ACP methyl ester carboxylesterase